MDKYPHYTIGELCNIEKGLTGIASAIPGEYPLVNTSAERKSCNTYQFDTEAVCIPLVSSTGHGKKSLNYVHYQKGKFALGTILAAVIPKEPKKLSAAFLHRYLQFNKDRKIVPLMKGAANVSLAVKDIAKIEIPVPPIDEQTSFIELFNNLNDSSTKLQSEFSDQSSFLSLLRQSILQEAIEGKLTETWRKKNPVRKGDPEYDATALLEKIMAEKKKMIAEGKIRIEKLLAPINPKEVPFELPEGWVWCRTNEICKSIVDCPHSTPRYIEKGMDCIDTTCFDESGILLRTRKVDEKTFYERNARLVPSQGDIIFSREGVIGQAIIIPSIGQYCLGQRVMLFRPWQNIPSKLFRLLITSPFFRQKMTESHKGMGAKHINMADLREGLIPLPPLAEQHTIIDRVDRLLSMVDELEKQVAERKGKAEELMQTVLREAFEG